MPIIFASSLLMLPPLLFTWLGQSWATTGLVNLFTNSGDVLQNPTSMIYNLAYIGMIYFFCYFWTAITFNPKEIADNLKDNGTFIPGYRPGRRTEDYLRARDRTNHLRRCRFPGVGRRHSNRSFPIVERRLHGCQFLWRHRTADCRQRRIRSGAKDRQSSGDAELQGTDGIAQCYPDLTKMLSMRQAWQVVLPTLPPGESGSQASSYYISLL